MPQGDSLLPWRTALDNAAIALENAGMSRAEARDQARRRSSPASVSKGPSGCDPRGYQRACGSESPSYARCSHARTCCSSTSRSARWMRLTRGELQEWLAGALADEPQTVLLVTHDIEEALLLCDRVAVLAHGRIATHPRGRRRARCRRSGFRRAARSGRSRRSREEVAAASCAARSASSPCGSSIVRVADVPDYLFPAPSAVAAALRDDAGTLGDATLVTAREMLLGIPPCGCGGAWARGPRFTSRPSCGGRCSRSSCSRRRCRRWCSRRSSPSCSATGLARSSSWSRSSASSRSS